MPAYEITVRYRTNSGCNAKTVIVQAQTIEEAFTLASDKVRRQRGVIKIDGGDGTAIERDTHNPYVSDDDVELDPATAAQYERDRREDDKAPDFDLLNHGSICLLTPRTAAAHDWADLHLLEDAMRWGPSSIVVEPRYVQAIIDGIEDEGLTIG